MRIYFFLLLLVCTCYEGYSQKVTIAGADNGLSIENNYIRFGGTLKKSTLLNGNLFGLKFLNLDSFIVNSTTHQFNSTKKTTITSSGDLSLSSLQNLFLHAGTSIAIDGKLKFNSYKNNDALDSVLTVDALGNIKLIAKEIPLVPGIIYSADNGLSLNNNFLGLGGDLKRSSRINGNYHSLRFADLDTFFLGGRHIQFLNSTKKTTISSYDSLNLQSLGSMLLSAPYVTVDGKIKFTGYKNSSTMDSILTVDNCGNLKLVSQGSLQTIAQNAFMNNGNSFGHAAYFGTNDNNNLHFKTKGIVRGSIDTLGILNYNHDVNINNAKLKATGNIEINGIQPEPATETQKASIGINFVSGGENVARGTISFSQSLLSMNYTSHGSLRFYSGLSGVPLKTLPADLVITEGLFRFGGRSSTSVDEPSAAYHFKDNADLYGKPRGVLFPKVYDRRVRDQQTTPAIGLIFYNQEADNLQIKKKDGWHNIVTQHEITTASLTASPASIENVQVNNSSYVQAVGDGQQKSFLVKHNLNAQYVMVQFIDCGPEANCNLLQILPKGAKVELDGKNNALITFDEAPSFNRYKIMFLRVQ